ncbi:periplasmic esterase [Escherichia coli]|nr:periplasmic esterase [Escherichia coli]
MKRTMLYLSLLAVSCSVSAAKNTLFLTESSPEKQGFNVERLNQMESLD